MNYTVDSANKALPYVRGVVAEIREVYASLQRLGNEHNALPRGDERGRADIKERIREGAQRIGECQEELLKIGVEVKDFESGLIDFPAQLEGRTILLCWKDGEEAVTHWHETNTGFRGRKAIPTGRPAWPRV